MGFSAIREEGHFVVVCTDIETNLTWVLARVDDGDDCPFFFTDEQASDIAERITEAASGSTAVAAEWFAAAVEVPNDEFDRIVSHVLECTE